MGQRGPKPQPTALRLLNGGASSRGVPQNEPRPPIPEACPEPPVYLTGYAREEWERVAGDLYATGCYANVDQTMLAAYCMAYLRWRTAEEVIEKMAKLDPTTHGMLVKTTNGNAIQNPAVGIASTARRDMARLAAEFGLTPSARTSIESGKGGERDPLASKYFG